MISQPMALYLRTRLVALEIILNGPTLIRVPITGHARGATMPVFRYAGYLNGHVLTRTVSVQRETLWGGTQ